jgi:hypothetical protein
MQIQLSLTRFLKKINFSHSTAQGSIHGQISLTAFEYNGSHGVSICFFQIFLSGTNGIDNSSVVIVTGIYRRNYGSMSDMWGNFCCPNARLALSFTLLHILVNRMFFPWSEERSVRGAWTQLLLTLRTPGTSRALPLYTFMAGYFRHRSNFTSLGDPIMKQYSWKRT